MRLASGVSISQSIAGVEKESVLVCLAIIFANTAMLTVLLIQYLAAVVFSFFPIAIRFA